MKLEELLTRIGTLDKKELKKELKKKSTLPKVNRKQGDKMRPVYQDISSNNPPSPT